MPVWYNIPIENIPTRYSHQWNRWFPEAFDRLVVQTEDECYEVGDGRTVDVSRDSFLDPLATNQYKAWQTNELMDRAAAFNENTILWFHDLWHPALIQLIYLRQVGGMKFKIAGVLFAGAHDPHDRLAQCNVKQWASLFERSVLPHVDLICVGSVWHRSLVLKLSQNVDPYRVRVISYPVAPQLVPDTPKEKLIVFPHRMAPEKRPTVAEALLDDVCAQCPGWSYVFTQRDGYSQEQYYDVLGRAAISLSTAMQETFGIAMVEATLAGCFPLMPNRLSYKELYSNPFLYRSDAEARKWLLAVMRRFDANPNDVTYSTILVGQRTKLAAITDPYVATNNMLHAARQVEPL